MAAALRFFSSTAAKTPDFGFGRLILFPSLSSICLELALPTTPLGALDEAFRACFAATADVDDDEAYVATDAPKDMFFFDFDAPAVWRIGGAILLLCAPLPTAPCRDLLSFTSCRSAFIFVVPLLTLRPLAAAAILALVPLDLFRISSCRDCFCMVLVMASVALADLVPTCPIFGLSSFKFSLNFRIFSPCREIFAVSRLDSA